MMRVNIRCTKTFIFSSNRVVHRARATHECPTSSRIESKIANNAEKFVFFFFQAPMSLPHPTTLTSIHASLPHFLPSPALASPVGSPSSQPNIAVSNAPCSTLFVANLGQFVSEHELKDIFSRLEIRTIVRNPFISIFTAIEPNKNCPFDSFYYASSVACCAYTRTSVSVYFQRTILIFWRL